MSGRPDIKPSMKAVRLIQPGGIDGLMIQDEEVPTLGRRDVLIRVHATALNYRDVVLANGHYPVPVRDKVTPLSDGAGEVAAIGAEVSRVRVGDRVTVNCNADWIDGRFVADYHAQSVGFSIDGMLSEYACFHENSIVRLPDYLTYEEAAALPCAAVSAWSALTFGEFLKPGQSVLIQGTGGVALFGLQIAKLFGARVLAITSSDEKAKRLEELGADAVVNYKTYPKWGRELLRLTGGLGVDKVVEIGGEKTIQESVNSTRYGGEIGLVGFVSGTGGGLPPMEILKKTITIRGIAMGPRLAFEDMLAAMTTSKVHPVLDSVFPFEEYKAAFQHLEKAKHIGKVIISGPR